MTWTVVAEGVEAEAGETMAGVPSSTSDPCAGCGADLDVVGLFIWNDRGRWCADCEKEAMRWPA